MEKAIVFLVLAINKSGHNPKPVIIHSILVGLRLAKLGYSAHITQAGILHDVVEDSDTKIESVQRKFGKRVADIVAACTHNRLIRNRTARHRDAVQRAAKAGREALIVTAADFIENEPYYKLAGNKTERWYLREKILYFINLAEPHLKNEPIWDQLKVLGKS